MKMIKSTKVRSTSGVMLISLYGFLPWTCIGQPSLFGRDGGGRGRTGNVLPRLGDPLFQLVDEDLVFGRDLFDAGKQVVVAEQRRDRDREAGDGGKQR